MAIKLNDLLRIQDLSNVKIRFNIKSSRIGFDPIDTYHQSREGILIANYYNSDKRIWFTILLTTIIPNQSNRRKLQCMRHRLRHHH